MPAGLGVALLPAPVADDRYLVLARRRRDCGRGRSQAGLLTVVRCGLCKLLQLLQLLLLLLLLLLDCCRNPGCVMVGARWRASR